MAAKLATVLKNKEDDNFNFFSEEKKELMPSIFGSEENKTDIKEENKTKYDINEDHFKKLLDITAEKYKEKEKYYLNSFKKMQYKEVYSFLNKKPAAFQKEITNEIIQDFVRYLDDKHAIFWNGMKLPRSVIVAIQSSFKIVSGHSFTSFLNLLKSKAYDSFGRETLKALNYLKISNVRISEDIDYQQSLENNEIVNKVMEENPVLFYPSFAYIGFKGLNQYQEMKSKLNSLGLTKKGWKFMCSQSKNYNLRAMRKIKVGIFCMNYGLKDAWLRNSFIASWMTRKNLSEKTDLLIKEIENYQGTIKSFAPIEVVQRKEGLSIRYESPQLDQLEDYLSNQSVLFTRNIQNRGKEFKEDSKTLFQLLRRSERWHEEILANSDKGALKNYLTFENSNMEIDGFKFDQILDSWELKKEGKKMHHCVFSYSDRCFRNQYAVFTVNELIDREDKKTLERATLGLNISEQQIELKDEKTNKVKLKVITNFSFSQMYGHCNSRVSDEMHDAAKKLIKELNKSVNGE